MAFSLPTLKVHYQDLEPHIDSQTMEIHYTKHHQGYVDKLNAALQDHPELQDQTIEQLLSGISKLPEEIQAAVRNNGGGHANHTLFWSILTPESTQPSSDLSKAIDESFGDFNAFKEAFTNAAATRFGSGWAWLVVKKDGKLGVESSPNQDSPIMLGETPILGLDVWEHAYYLKYQNRRPEYITAFWNIINWTQVSEYYQQATAK